MFKKLKNLFTKNEKDELLKNNDSKSTKEIPEFEFEVAPDFDPSQNDGNEDFVKNKVFDKVEYNNLDTIVFIDKRIQDDVLEIVYDGKYYEYLDKTIELLRSNNKKIIETKFAKSITAWIYSDNDYVLNYNIDQKNAMKRLGREIPVYHLIDVWKFLNTNYNKIEKLEDVNLKIKPKHQRVQLEQIKNINNSDNTFEKGFNYWEMGDEERKLGNIEESIKLFDKARSIGFLTPALYSSYAMAYRKLKDYENEIAILEEGIMRIQDSGMNVSSHSIIKWKLQKIKAEENFIKLNES